MKENKYYESNKSELLDFCYTIIAMNEEIEHLKHENRLLIEDNERKKKELDNIFENTTTEHNKYLNTILNNRG
jgi:hypothetical protein